MAANFFTVAGATATNSADSGTVIAVFPATVAVPDIKIATVAIAGVIAPVTGATPTSTITATTEYTATISWSPVASPFAASTPYTATITLTPKTGFTLTGVAANSFTVSGATPVTNSASSGVVTAVFPSTGASQTDSAPPRALTPNEWVTQNLNIDQLVNHYGATPTGFLDMLYDNSMLRIPDESGLNYWNEKLTGGVFGANFVTEHFIFSDEIGAKVAAMTSAEYVNFLYSTLFARVPDTDGYNNWLGYINSGFSKEETLRAFLNNEEWINICKMFNVIP